MALGDGIRRNIRTVGLEERQRFREALLAVQGRLSTESDGHAGFGGPSGFRQIERHLETNAHHGVDFLPWHRELCNRFERLLREVDPLLSLHYWDWNEDPRDLFTSTFASCAPAGSERRFDPAASDVQRARLSMTPDSVILRAPTFRRLWTILERKRAQARFVYFGGTMVNAHVSLHDPFGILLCANVDRLYAMWQAERGQAWRLDPGRVYGEDDGRVGDAFIEPWATEVLSRPLTRGALPAPKTYAHPSVVAPPCYQTLPTRIAVDEDANPGRVIGFRDVAAGKTFARAASFRVHGRGNLTLAVIAGPSTPYSVITPGPVVTVPHAANLYQEVRIWFAYTGGRPGTSAPSGTVTIRCEDTDQDFVFTLQANTAAAAAWPSQSGDDSGDRRDQPMSSRARDVTWTWSWKAAGL